MQKSFTTVSYQITFTKIDLVLQDDLARRYAITKNKLEEMGCKHNMNHFLMISSRTQSGIKLLLKDLHNLFVKHAPKGDPNIRKG